MAFAIMEANFEYNDNTYDRMGSKPVKVVKTRERAVELVRQMERKQIEETDCLSLGYGRINHETIQLLKSLEPAVKVHLERGLPEEFLEDPKKFLDDQGMEGLCQYVGEAVKLMTDEQVEHMLQCLDLDLFDIQEVEVED